MMSYVRTRETTNLPFEARTDRFHFIPQDNSLILIL